MRTMIAAVSLLCLGAPAAQAAGPEMIVPCQQNTTDQRILVSDYRLLPEKARFKILSYRPQRVSADTWTNGECRIQITGRWP